MTAQYVFDVTDVILSDVEKELLKVAVQQLVEAAVERKRRLDVESVATTASSLARMTDNKLLVHLLNNDPT